MQAVVYLVYQNYIRNWVGRGSHNRKIAEHTIAVHRYRQQLWNSFNADKNTISQNLDISYPIVKINKSVYYQLFQLSFYKFSQIACGI